LNRHFSHSPLILRDALSRNEESYFLLIELEQKPSSISGLIFSPGSFQPEFFPALPVRLILFREDAYLTNKIKMA